MCIIFIEMFILYLSDITTEEAVKEPHERIIPEPSQGSLADMAPRGALSERECADTT